MIPDGILRIFPRKTKATPTDAMAAIGQPSRKWIDAHDIREAHVSVTFTWDIPKAEEIAERLAKWGVPVDIGGPAYGDRMGDFVPGMYIRDGYIFTSRGCPSDCWFCSVAECARGQIRELPIYDGYNILDDNILATSKDHFAEVIKMLKRQKERPIFTGGIEAALLTPWHAQLMKEVRTKRLFCAYDMPADYEPLVQAGRILRDAGFTVKSHELGCYVLIGYREDTFDAAEKRLIDTIKAGFTPFAMLYRDKDGFVDKEWRAFQREWCAPQIVGAKMREYGGKL